MSTLTQSRNAAPNLPPQIRPGKFEGSVPIKAPVWTSRRTQPHESPSSAQARYNIGRIATGVSDPSGQQRFGNCTRTNGKRLRQVAPSS
jgi:hypothetical protein